MVRLWVYLLVGLMIGAPSAVAEESPGSVLLASDDIELQRSLPATLAPLGMSVVVVSNIPAPAPPQSSGGNDEPERAIAAAIWISRNQPGSQTLNVRDHRTGRALQRAIPYASPLAPADAASVALMARTMLTTLRGSSEETAALSPPPVPSPRPAPDESRTVEQRTFMRVDVGAGARLAPTKGWLSPAFIAAIAWYPARWGLGVSVIGAQATDVDTSTFTGTVGNQSAACGFRLPVPLGSRVVLEPLAGISLHWMRVRGTAAAMNGRPVEHDAFDPGLFIGGRLAVAATRAIELALWVEGDALMRRQRYLYGSEELLVVPHLRATLGLTMGLALR